MGNLAALPRNLLNYPWGCGLRRCGLLLALAMAAGALLAGCANLPASPALEAARAETVAIAGTVAEDAAAGTAAQAAPAAGDGTPPPLVMDPAMVVAAHEQVIKDLYEKALPSVVFIQVTRNLGAPNRTPAPEAPEVPDSRLFPEGFFPTTAGSGFVWDDAGHIVTNHHVVAGNDRVTVILPDDTELEGEVLGSDPDSDLALLRVEAPPGLLTPVILGDSDAVAVGQVAAALGNPFGHEFSITSGIISGVGRTIRSGNSPFSIPEVLQTDASLNPGNSGGPLLDRQGQVIGVNTQIISRTGSSSGIGFAVPINIAKQVIPALLETGKFDYPWLGISGSNLRPAVAELMGLPRDTRGALVIEALPDGPAAQAGLRAGDQPEMVEGREMPLGGDVIVSIDGSPVRGIDDVITYLVTRTRPEQTITLEVLRDGGRAEVAVTLGVRPGSL